MILDVKYPEHQLYGVLIKTYNLKRCQKFMDQIYKVTSNDMINVDKYKEYSSVTYQVNMNKKDKGGYKYDTFGYQMVINRYGNDRKFHEMGLIAFVCHESDKSSIKSVLKVLSKHLKNDKEFITPIIIILRDDDFEYSANDDLILELKNQFKDIRQYMVNMYNTDKLKDMLAAIAQVIFDEKGAKATKEYSYESLKHALKTSVLVIMFLIAQSYALNTIYLTLVVLFTGIILDLNGWTMITVVCIYGIIIFSFKIMDKYNIDTKYFWWIFIIVALKYLFGINLLGYNDMKKRAKMEKELLERRKLFRQKRATN